MISELPTPHGDKLRAARDNPKLPSSEIERVEMAIEKYEDWIGELNSFADSSELSVEPMVSALTEYKNWLDIELIFDSSEDVLWRDRGQLKLDNSVLEEFLPWLVSNCVSPNTELSDLRLGPINAYAHLQFESTALNRQDGGGIRLRSKDQDFAVSLPLTLRTSHDANFEAYEEIQTNLAYLAIEIKTNLDKTMFQEASATASDLKLAIPGSKYFLLCEWLDMTPISTDITAIEEVIVTRRAKRMSSSIRKSFADAAGRRRGREEYVRHLTEHPFSSVSFKRLLDHISTLLSAEAPDQEQVLERGWF